MFAFLILPDELNVKKNMDFIFNWTRRDDFEIQLIDVKSSFYSAKTNARLMCWTLFETCDCRILHG